MIQIVAESVQLTVFCALSTSKMPIFAQVRGGPNSNIITFGSPINFLSVQISAIFR